MSTKFEYFQIGWVLNKYIVSCSIKVLQRSNFCCVRAITQEANLCAGEVYLSRCLFKLLLVPFH
uniref:Uncharacterized protein n=1 Tax=Rhizophora mucronata TaxID=61149 RepID=A0A2P2P5Q1_RHIMU